MKTHSLHLQQARVLASAKKHLLLDRLSVFILVSAMLMNFILAIVHNNLFAIDSMFVTVTQTIVTGCALFLIVIRRPRVRTQWYLIIAAMLFCVAASSISQQYLDLRFLYNVLLLPIFLLLGSTVRLLKVSVLKWLLTAVCLVSAFEILFVDAYSHLVNPLGYYASTREWVAGALGENSTSTGLYVGATRPQGLFFGLSSHRIGSIFLEPLSLAYFSVIIYLVFAYCFRFNTLRSIPIILICLLLSALSDTRTAFTLLVLVILFGNFFQYVPRHFGYLLPIGIVLLMFTLYVVSIEYIPEIAYRLSITFDAFRQSDIWEILIGGIPAIKTNDSGLVQLISGLGLLGTLLFFWAASGLASGYNRTTTYSSCVVIFIMATSFFGGAIFSIKTAAFLGFVTGAIGVGALPQYKARKSGET